MNHTLQEIFKIIEGREWDKFNHKIIKEISKNKVIFVCDYAEDCMPFATLPDLLANPSWCKCVWGESGYYTGAKFTGITTMREAHDRVDEFRLGLHYKCHKEKSIEAFQKLQQESEQACLNFIYETMKK